MKPTSEFDPADYHWTPQPATATFVKARIEQACNSCSWLAQFRQRLLTETGTRLVDWLDHIAVATPAGLAAAGFVTTDDRIYKQPNGIFPTFTIAQHLPDDECRLGLKVDKLEDFLSVHEQAIAKQNVFGDTGAQVRIAQLEFHDGHSICVVERHGHQTMIPGNHENAEDMSQRERVLDSFRSRDRSYENAEAAFKEAAVRFSQAASVIGPGFACDLFFQSEREYWQGRNTAARTQYERQQSLGLGWANHDHHTYRCSRIWFKPLILTLELMGFVCRERFYAGADAGWGAQVLEHPDCGIVIFADVDMSEDEIVGDFPHEGLIAKDELGTVGLWCELHGDSFTTAGLHHLECQFDFAAARDQLAELGIESMAPFTDFPYLKQAFTRGEIWRVPAPRLAKLVAAGVIQPDDAKRFEAEGVIGSHLEILERNDGFKGFNQTGISRIIRQTNPTLAD